MKQHWTPLSRRFPLSFLEGLRVGEVRPGPEEYQGTIVKDLPLDDILSIPPGVTIAHVGVEPEFIPCRIGTMLRARPGTVAVVTYGDPGPGKFAHAFIVTR